MATQMHLLEEGNLTATLPIPSYRLPVSGEFISISVPDSDRPILYVVDSVVHSFNASPLYEQIPRVHVVRVP